MNFEFLESVPPKLGLEKMVNRKYSYVENAESGTPRRIQRYNVSLDLASSNRAGQGLVFVGLTWWISGIPPLHRSAILKTKRIHNQHYISGKNGMWNHGRCLILEIDQHISPQDPCCNKLPNSGRGSSPYFGHDMDSQLSKTTNLFPQPWRILLRLVCLVLQAINASDSDLRINPLLKLDRLEQIQQKA